MDLHPHPSLTAIRCNSVPESPDGSVPEGLAGHPLSFSPEQICTRILLQQPSAAILFPRVLTDPALKALRGILYPSARNRFARGPFSGYIGSLLPCNSERDVHNLRERVAPLRASEDTM